MSITSSERTRNETMNLALRRKLRFWNTRLREWRMIAKGLASKRHPVLAHLIPIRRCNLSCTYCNEFDNFSKPIALEEMFHRVDLLAGARHHDHHHQRRRAAAASRIWRKSSAAFAGTAFWRA